MSTPINTRDLRLQATTPRLLQVGSNYISLSAPSVQFKYGATNVAQPTQSLVTATLVGALNGQTVTFSYTGLDPVPTASGNTVGILPESITGDFATVTATLAFLGVTYTNSISFSKIYNQLVASVLRPLDVIASSNVGTDYTLPGTNYLELYNGGAKVVTGVTYGPATTTKNGLTVQVNTSTGEITVTQASSNAWTSGSETFTLTVTKAGIGYNANYIITKAKAGISGGSVSKIYKVAANSAAVPNWPATPYKTPAGTIPTGWSETPVTLTGTQAQFTSDGVMPTGSAETTWSTPYLSYFKVDTLEAITANTGSLTVTGTFKAGTAELNTTTNTINSGTAGGILYSSGNFAFGNDTTNISFNGTTLKLNGNVVGRANIVDGAINTDKFASGLEPVTLVTSVPSTKSTNSIFNTTDSKLYRWNGTSYVATVPAADVTGQLTNSQIADIAAAKLTGQITETQITDSAISTAKLAAGAITAAKIAADTITADQIAANAITTNEIAAGAITAAKIAANTITASQIAANTITAGQIATGTITADQIAANTITASKIDSSGLSIKDTAGNVILSAGSSLATSSFTGNVTGSVNGTAASTVLSNITAAQGTADTAVGNAATAQNTANTAVTNAATAQSTANSKLAKSGADILTGPISLNAASAISVGTPALDNVSGHNGFYIGSTGIVGTKNGAATFTLDNNGNAIFAGQLSAATGSFGGNVTGTVGGTSATTLISDISTANTTASNASTAAATAQSTANTANNTANTANNTANTANNTANTANNTANTALTNAATAQSTANAKLAKAGADTLVGPISLTASNAILVGTVNDGLYLGSTGIVGRKASQTTFAVDASGNAIFKGDLTGASGTFAGSLSVGSSPAVSGTTMSGSGGKINSDGTFALGNSSTNITYNGTTLYLNGNIVGTGNIQDNAITSDGSTVSSTAISAAFFNGQTNILQSGTWTDSLPSDAYIGVSGVMYTYSRIILTSGAVNPGASGKVNIIISVAFQSGYYTIDNGDSVTYKSYYPVFSLYRGTANTGGAVLLQTFGAMPIITGLPGQPGAFAFNHIDSPGNNSTIYTLVLRDPVTNDSGNAVVYQRSMLVQAVKK